MKIYGANRATEFSKKQINVLYGLAKRGELKIEKWLIKKLYDLAEYYGYDSNRSVADDERHILSILETVFAGDLVKAQEAIDEYTERSFLNLGRKNAENCDRTFI